MEASRITAVSMLVTSRPVQHNRSVCLCASVMGFVSLFPWRDGRDYEKKRESRYCVNGLTPNGGGEKNHSGEYARHQPA